MVRMTAFEARRLAQMASKKSPTSVRHAVPQAQTPRKAGRLPRGGAEEGPALSFTIPIAPHPKKRARTFMPIDEVLKAFHQSQGNPATFKSKMESIKHQSITPAATREFEGVISQVAACTMRGSAPLDVPVEMTIRFVFSGDPDTWPVASSDGDLDNLEKAVKDALNKIAYVDDRLVVRKSSIKECGPQDLIEITVRPAT